MRVHSVMMCELCLHSMCVCVACGVAWCTPMYVYNMYHYGVQYVLQYVHVWLAGGCCKPAGS
jgi:hypothetical protein